MPFIKLDFKPGLNKDQSNYSNEGGWWECDKIRFRSGYPEKLGGWVKYTVQTLIGVCRQMFVWVTSFGDNLMAMGTNKKVYIEAGGNLFDITPIRQTTVNVASFAAVDGSSIVTVTDTGSNPAQGGYVIFSGAASLGGNVTATILNTEHEITTAINADAYTITVPVVANSSDSGNGGGAVTAKYQIDPSSPNYTFGYGWNTSTWSRGGWGSGSDQPVDLPTRYWWYDNFDNDLVMNYNEDGFGPIYYWERGSSANPTNSLNTPAVLLSSLSGASNVPTYAGQVLVSQNDKHLLAFGSTPYPSGAFDPLLIRWADQDNPVNWTPSPTNSAGFIRVSRGDQIVRAIATRQEILVYTNTGLSSLQFTGTTDVFSLQELADNISILSPRGVAVVNNVTYWMGRDKFYVYSGRVDTLPTTLWTQVFKNLNYNRANNIVAGTNEGYNEIWWFYPSANSDDNDSYVVYNYVERLWHYGTLARTAWNDSGLREYPQAIQGEYIYDHERGLDADGTPMVSYITSSEFDIGDGEQFMLTRRMIPDIKFTGSTAQTPEVYITLVPRRFPGSPPQSEPNLRVIETSANIYTNEVFIRARGRSMSFEVGSDTLGVAWQLGSPRLDARQDGKR
jgi:hypothetical protein